MNIFPYLRRLLNHKQTEAAIVECALCIRAIYFRFVIKVTSYAHDATQMCARVDYGHNSCSVYVCNCYA